jgi:hypothetical protein
MKLSEKLLVVLVLITSSSISNANPATYIPVTFEPSKEKVEIVRGGNIVEADIRTLNKKELWAFLGLIDTKYILSKVDTNNQLTYISNNFAIEKGRYVAILEFTKYTNLPYIVDGQRVGLQRVGVGVRVTADVKTDKKNLNLSSLFNIGLAASKEELSGKLSLETMGIVSADIPGITAALDSSSIQKAIETLAVTLTYLKDESTTITPYRSGIVPDIEIKLNDIGLTAPTLLN